MKKNPTTIAIVGLVLYILPFIISGSDSNIVIHDNLDNNVVRYIVMAEEGKTLAINPNSEIERMMGGLPRMFFPNGLNVVAILFLIFNPFTAYLLNFILVHAVAFAGMHLLLRKHILQEQQDKSIVAFTSLCFAIIPFYSIYGISVAGVPLVLFAFLNLYKGAGNRYDFFILVFFALYSQLILVGVFVIACAVGGLLFRYWKTRTFERNYNLGVLVLTVAYLVSNFHIFYQFFLQKVVLHRVEFVHERHDFVTVINNAADFFTTLHYHVSSPLGFILAIFVPAWVLGVVNKHGSTLLITLLALINISIAFLQSLFTWEMFEPVNAAIPLTAQFQWNRFYYLSPLFWFIQLALSLQIIRDSTISVGLHRIAIAVAAIYVAFSLWKANTEFRETTYNLFSSNRTGWSFRQFFDSKLFSEIKDHIGKPLDKYRVASIGMHPAVPLYNGFHTIDGYLPSYPLSYKKEFRKIIAEELERSGGMLTYFDHWGSRCYLYPAQLGYNFTLEKNSGVVLKDLRYNFAEGPRVDYIFSAAEIGNPEAVGLRFVKKFEHAQSRWEIFLYEVNRELLRGRVMLEVTGEFQKDDVFQLFFQTDRNAGWDEVYSVSKPVRGSTQLQTIAFPVSDTLNVSRFRLDLGINAGQGPIKIKSFAFKRGQKSAPVSTDAFAVNGFIERNGESYTMKVLDGRYDPYGEFDHSMVEAYRAVKAGHTDRQ